MSEPSKEQVEALANAMWQLLDDMIGPCQSVCLLAKVEARAAMEPFLTEDRPECDGWMTLAEANDVIKQCTRS